MNASGVCLPGNDDSFGPLLTTQTGCRRSFDYTLLFEQSVLSLAPSAVLILFAVFRVLQLYGRAVITLPTLLRYGKSAAFLCAAGLRLALLVLWATKPDLQTKISVPAAALSLLATSTLVVLSNLEHSRSVRPSSIINVYLLLCTILDIAQARTLWLLPFDSSLAGAFTACIAFNLVLMVLESVEKRKFLKPPFRDYPPEALGGVFNRSVFWWLNNLFRNGYGRILQFDDMYIVDEELSAEILQQRIQSTWQTMDKSRKHCLLLAAALAFKWPLFRIIIPRLCVSALKFCQPLLISRVVALMAEPRNEENRNISYGLIGATGLIYFALAIFNARHKHMVYRAIIMIRGGLVSLVSDATLTLDADIVKESAAVTLMSTDVDRIVAGLEMADFIWASPIETVVALYLLNREIGLACLVPLVITLASATAAYFIGKISAPAQRRWADAVQKRVGVTASMLSSMKAVKMMGIAEQLSGRVQDLKLYELEQSKKLRRINTLRNAIGHFSEYLAPALTFAVYSILYIHTTGRSFTPAVAFTSLSIISLLSQAIQWWVNALVNFQSSLGCWGRIQDYLLSKTRKDHRLPGGGDATKCVDDPKNILEAQDLPQSRTESKPESVNGFAVAVRHASFGFPNREPVLRDVHFRIRDSTLTMLIGPVGSGKSVLLRALLGEIAPLGGKVYTSHRSVAYCGQEPWLPNVTIRQSIIGVSDFEHLWYNTVIQACALKPDIQQFPDGDSSLIGSKGISLSGGQKQRLAVARAIYSRKQILLLDDVLSGLDGKTEQAVFQRCFGPDGLCRKLGTTVLLAIHAIKHLHYADLVLSLDKHGTPSEKEVPKQPDFHLAGVSGAADQEGVGAEDDTRPASNELLAAQPVQRQLVNNLSSKVRSTGDLQIYVYYARMVGWILGVYLCIQACTTFLTKFPDVWLRWWSAAEVSDPGKYTSFYLGIYCMFGALALCSLAIGLLTLSTGVMPKSSSRLHQRLLDTVMNARYSFLSATDSGMILNRFSQDMSLVDMQLTNAILQTADGLMVSITQAVLIATSSKFVSTLIPGAIIVLYLVQRLYLRTSRQVRLLDLETKSPMYSHFLETFSGLITLRAFGWQPSWSEESRKLLDRSQRPVYMLYCIQRWLGFVLDCMVAICAIVVITLATQLNNGGGASGGLGVALVNLLSMSNMLSVLVRAWTDMETSLGSVHRIKDFESDTPSELAAGQLSKPTDVEWPRYGAIQFQNLEAGYDSPPYSSEISPPESILKDITISIPAGSRVGICGRTGSGKSSLLLTVFRLTEIISGSIIIDDVDINTLSRASLRNRLVAVPQSPELFPGTWRENLDPSSCFTDEVIIAALERVGLWNKLESRGGLYVNPDQDTLSHGERQLFTLACALLRRQALGKSKDAGGIVVLDEVSASVDVETELRMLKVVHEEFAGWTVLSVAHRLDTIQHCDLILVMEAGRVAEYGPPEELRSREGGHWREMLRSLGVQEAF